MATPAAEIDIDEPLIRSLLADQYPALAQSGIHIVCSGWDNVIARAGDWAIRLPRRALGAKLMEHELRWLPRLAGRLPIPVPVPVFAGKPGAQFPWSWSITRWLPGTASSVDPPVDSAAAARTLAGFLVALHQPAPDDAPVNLFRGVPLAHRDEPVRTRAEALREVIDAEKVIAVWQDLLATPAWSGPALWLHGDLHPANMLTHEGRLSAVIDFGDITSGDPATDLAAGWMMFDRAGREVFCSAAALTGDTWRRAAAWALGLSLVFLAADEDTPMPEIGRATLRAVLEEFG